MSSKAIGPQQQGRRTPLSLAGGRQSNNHQQQQQNQHHSNSKGNSNANQNFSKTQETKDNNLAKNGNTNAGKNQDSTNHQTQKELKKQQQQQKQNSSNVDHVKKSNGNGNAELPTVAEEQNGNAKANGHTNSNNNKNAGNSTNKQVAQTSNASLAKDPNEKEHKDAENNKEKTKKKEETLKVNETKKENDIVTEIQTAQVGETINLATSKDETSSPTLNIENKKQTTTLTRSSQRKTGTPTNIVEKVDETSNKKSPATNKTDSTSKSPKSAKNVTEPIVIDEDVETEILPLVLEESPMKKTAEIITIPPGATSTPGKAIITGNRRGGGTKSKSEALLTHQDSASPICKNLPRSFSQISGRRSIRPVDDFSSSMYNQQFRESYRRINTELDVTGNTNTSMNVTVGSELPNNSSFLSFSLFGRGRKRERTPPAPSTPAKSQSAVELSTDTTPPKRARLDGILSVMASPLTLLRTRFSKTTLDTPAKQKDVEIENENVDVQNVSGISIEEVVSSTETTTTNNISVGTDAVSETTPTKQDKKAASASPKEKGEDVQVTEKVDETKGAVAMDVDGDIKITETLIVDQVDNPKIKQRGCMVM